MVHPLGLLWEWLRYVRAPSKALPYGLRFVECSLYRVIPLALISQVITVATQEVAPRTIQKRNPAAASRTRTNEPRPLSTEVARRPS